jgi:hypothetical protein
MSAIPPHKLITVSKGLYLLVDGFTYAKQAPAGKLFFLTHAHSRTRITTPASARTGRWAPSSAASAPPRW